MSNVQEDSLLHGHHAIPFIGKYRIIRGKHFVQMLVDRKRGSKRKTPSRPGPKGQLGEKVPRAERPEKTWRELASKALAKLG